MVNFKDEAWFEEVIRLAWLVPFSILDCLTQLIPKVSVGMNGQLPVLTPSIRIDPVDSHNLKLMSGMNYSYLDGGTGGGDFDGWTWLVGVRLAF